MTNPNAYTDLIEPADGPTKSEPVLVGMAVQAAVNVVALVAKLDGATVVAINAFLAPVTALAVRRLVVPKSRAAAYVNGSP